MAKLPLNKGVQPAKIIYDLGANVGSNLEYYLKKADRVVAVEANPALAEKLQNKFASAISAGQLFIEQSVISVEKNAAKVPFYIHKQHSAISQFPKPDEDIIKDFDCVLLPAISIAEIIKKYGAPWYIKIDLEHYDAIVLKSLFENNIRPPFISAEAHHADILISLAGIGGYKAFQSIDAYVIPNQYKNYTIQTRNGAEKYSFAPHSAGPCADDLGGEWLTAENVIGQLAVERFGWKDIHATTEHVADPKQRPHLIILRIAKLLWIIKRALRYPASIIPPS
jgi:FkbM family methyltransferase